MTESGMDTRFLFGMAANFSLRIPISCLSSDYSLIFKVPRGHTGREQQPHDGYLVAVQTNP